MTILEAGVAWLAMVARKPADRFVAELESAIVVVKHAALFTP